MINYKKSNTEAIESIDLYFNSNVEDDLIAYPVFLDAACSKQPEDVSKIKDIVISKNINLIDIGFSDLGRESLCTFKPTFVQYNPLTNGVDINVIRATRNGPEILELRLDSAQRSGAVHLGEVVGDEDDGK